MKYSIGLCAVCLIAAMGSVAWAAESTSTWDSIAPYFTPPVEFAGKMGSYRSPLLFDDGTRVQNAGDWARRRGEIIRDWQKITGAWPPVIERPTIEYLETAPRENFVQHHVRVQIAPTQVADGYILSPKGNGPFAAVFVPFYEPQTSIGLGGKSLRDFALQLTRRGFVTLSIGSPGGDARKPDLGGHQLQPLSYLGYVGANCCNALASLAVGRSQAHRHRRPFLWRQVGDVRQLLLRQIRSRGLV